jgi:hypothetical protein
VRLPRLAGPAVAISILLIACASASAQVVLGQAPPDSGSAEICEFDQGYDEFQTSVSSGAGYTVPAPGGLVTSWSTQAGPGDGQRLMFKVFRPAGAGVLSVVGHDERALTPNALNTFPIGIPVQAGDVIGLHVFGKSESAVTQCAFKTGAATDKIEYWPGNAADGAPTSVEDFYLEYRLNIAATLLPPPVVSAIAPAAGSVKGKSSVVVSGSNFAEVRAVSFGSTPASAFTVDSEGQITATAPASKTIAAVPITVTTGAGTATSAQSFAYEGCKVPKLKGKKLKASKKKLKKGDCKTGKVSKRKGATAATGKVVKQSPKPGSILAPGAKVKVTLGP